MAPLIPLLVAFIGVTVVGPPVLIQFWMSRRANEKERLTKLTGAKAIERSERLCAALSSLDKPKDEIVDAAIRRLEIVMQQNRFEHNAFWTRFGFMLVSQMALLGFFTKIVGDSLAAMPSERRVASLLFALTLPAIGLMLLVRFQKLHEITGWWIQHWLNLSAALESRAFGDVAISRGLNDEANLLVGSVRDQARWLNRMLIAAWVILTLAAIIGFKFAP